MPGLGAGPSWRVVSPAGGSILITSAPRSPSCWAAHGPSTTVVQSRILTPSNGPAIDVTSTMLSPRLPQVGHACAGNVTGQTSYGRRNAEAISPNANREGRSLGKRDSLLPPPRQAWLSPPPPPSPPRPLEPPYPPPSF